MADGDHAWLRWYVLLASTVSLAFSPGPMIFASIGLFVPHMVDSLGWSRGQIMLALTFFNIGGFLASPYTGRLIDRLGARRVILVSLALFAGGFLALAYAGASLALYLAVAGIWGLLTVGAQSISYARLLVSWFPRSRGMAIGISAAGLGVGYMVLPLIVSEMLARMPWQSAMAALGAIVIAGPFLLDLAFARAPSSPTVLAQSDEQRGATLAEARGSDAFWLIAGAIFLMSAVLTGIVPHIVGLSTDAGLGVRAAAQVASLYGATTLIGRLVVGVLVDRLPVRFVAIFFFAVAAAGFALLAGVATSGGPLLVAAAMMVGAGFGAESDLIAIFISRYFGQRAFGAIYGWLLSAFILGAAIGPTALAFGRDALGGYRGLMLCAAGVSALAVLLIVMLRAEPRLQEGAEATTGS